MTFASQHTDPDTEGTEGAASLFHLFRLISPSLPIGAFAYSQGFEYAIDAGWITNASDTFDWIQGQCQTNLATIDIPLFKRLFCAWQCNNIGAASHWNHHVIAHRDTHELRDEERQLGQTLQRCLTQLTDTVTQDHPCALTEITPPSYLNGFAYATVAFNIPLPHAVQGLIWQWVENQISVACKSLPLGQSEAQRCLVNLTPIMQHAIKLGLSLNDEQIGNQLPAVSLASCLHESQYSRLFRS